jgi:hypothetical protein
MLEQSQHDVAALADVDEFVAVEQKVDAAQPRRERSTRGASLRD